MKSTINDYHRFNQDRNQIAVLAAEVAKSYFNHNFSNFDLLKLYSPEANNAKNGSNYPGALPALDSILNKASNRKGLPIEELMPLIEQALDSDIGTEVEAHFKNLKDGSAPEEAKRAIYKAFVFHYLRWR